MTGLAMVTGAAGFIGAYVVRQLLDEGYAVIGIGHPGSTPFCAPGYTWHEAEVDESSLRALGCVPDMVIHCAGSASVARSIESPEEERRRTIGSAAAVLDFAAALAPKAKLVLISSAAVYGHVESQPIAESEPLVPVSPYGEYKRQAEELWRAHSAFHKLQGVIVRLFSVYGEGLRKQLLWDACRKLSAGNREFGGTGDESRDWLHAADAARLLVLAARHANQACPVVNGGTGQAIPVREVLAELSNALELTGAPHFNGVARPGDPVRYLADVSRAQAWRWEPEIEWRQGIRRYARWFRGGAT
jgi:UDP-glucose 4-epimerase